MPTPKSASSKDLRSGAWRRLFVPAGVGLSTALALALVIGKWREHKPIKTPEPSASSTDRPEGTAALPEIWADAFRTEESTEGRIRALSSSVSPNERLQLMRLLQEYGTGGTAALPLLGEFLRHPDQAVRRAAMRGLATTQSPQAISMLQTYLADTIAMEESTEAALALATMEDARVTPILQTALEGARDATLREHLVDALVSRPHAQSGPFIDAFLQRSDVGLDEKQNLLRMTGLNSTKSAEFFAGFLDDSDEQLRHGAYQGLALVADARQTQILMPRIEIETDPVGRGLLYEALGNQLDANPASLGTLTDGEQDAHARLRALKAWTEAAAREGSLLAADGRANSRLAELQDAALNHPDFAERRIALFALGYVRQDPSARAALEQVARGSNSEKIRALARALLANRN